MALLACPFCREMFPSAQTEVCPLCALPLRVAHKLPPSRTTLNEHDELQALPEDELRLPWWSLAHGRGALLACGVGGLFAFFLPWIDLRFPVVAQLSGFDLAQRLRWTWAVPAAWLVLLPVVLSRRTAKRMQSATVAVCMLCVFPGLSLLTLWRNPPHGSRGLLPEFSYAPAFWLSLALALLGVLCGLRFGRALWRRPS